MTAAVAELSPSLGANVPLGVQVRAVPAPGSDADVDFAAGVAAAIEDLAATGCGWRRSWPTRCSSSDGVAPAAPRAGGRAGARGGRGLTSPTRRSPGSAGPGRICGGTHPGLVPDLVTMGKPIGERAADRRAGRPAAGAGGLRQRARYFNTFGGNPVCVAAASAVLDVLADEDRRVPSVGARAAGFGQRGGGARGGLVRRGGRGVAVDRSAVGRAGGGDRQPDGSAPPGRAACAEDPAAASVRAGLPTRTSW